MDKGVSGSRPPVDNQNIKCCPYSLVALAVGVALKILCQLWSSSNTPHREYIFYHAAQAPAPAVASASLRAPPCGRRGRRSSAFARAWFGIPVGVRGCRRLLVPVCWSEVCCVLSFCLLCAVVGGVVLVCWVGLSSSPFSWSVSFSSSLVLVALASGGVCWGGLLSCSSVAVVVVVGGVSLCLCEVRKSSPLSVCRGIFFYHSKARCEGKCFP